MPFMGHFVLSDLLEVSLCFQVGVHGSGHGPQAEVAQAFGLEPLVELGGRHLEGPEEEQRNEEEKETGEEKQPQRNAQVHMHGWDDACKADLSHGAM